MVVYHDFTRHAEGGNTLIFSRIALFFWYLSIAGVSWLCLTPCVELPITIRYGDKIYHAIAYLWLAVLPFLGFERFRNALTGALSMVLLGVAIEFVQDWVPGRTFSVLDMFANGMGVALGIFVGWQFWVNVGRLNAIRTSHKADEPN